MGTKNKLFILIYLFCFIYFPPLFSFNMLHALTVFSIIALISNYRKNHYIQTVKVLRRYYIFPFLFIIFYLVLIAVVNERSLFVVYTTVILGLEIPICVIYILAYFIKRKYTVTKIFNTLLIVAIIQAVISLLAFLVPAFKDILVNLYIKNQTNDYVSSSVIQYMASTRLNGLSSNLTFTTPVVQAMMAITSIYLSIHRNFKYIYFTPILIISSVINSRSSLVVLALGLVLVLLSMDNKREALKRFVRISVLISFACLLIITFIPNLNTMTFDWIYSGVNEISMYFQGEKIGYFEVAFSNFIHWPEGISVFFGTGQTIFGYQAISSDIGYINDVWLGGVIYVVMAYGTFGFFYYNAFRKHVKFVKFTIMLFITTFILMNIKGAIISNNDFMNVTILLTTTFILNKRNVIKYD